MIRGSFDVVTTAEALGWAYAPGQMEPVLVQAVLNQEVVGEALADIHRPDLAAAGVGDGNAGFAIRFFRAIDPLYLPFISVKVEGGDAELPRSPLAGFKEFFNAVHVAFPAAGRHRSLSGGLWTDRTDAASLLQGKTRIGTVPPSAAPVVEQLIHNGAAVVDLAAAPELSTWRSNLAACTGSLLDEPAMLALLRSVLEDNPMAVKADWLEYGETDFTQPTSRNPSPAPGECVELVIAFGEGVTLDVIRGSHKLPEFTLNGKSRWTTPSAGNAASAAGPMGLLDSLQAATDAVTLVGPGTIYRIRCELGTPALRLVILPARGRTVEVDASSVIKDEARRSGAMVLI